MGEGRGGGGGSHDGRSLSRQLVGLVWVTLVSLGRCAWQLHSLFIVNTGGCMVHRRDCDLEHARKVQNIHDA